MGLIARFSEQASKITDVKSAHSDATPAKPPSERQFDAPVHFFRLENPSHCEAMRRFFEFFTQAKKLRSNADFVLNSSHKQKMQKDGDGLNLEKRVD